MDRYHPDCAEKMKIARFFSRRLAIVILAVAGLVGLDSSLCQETWIWIG
jgi:hypothetical protein